MRRLERLAAPAVAAALFLEVIWLLWPVGPWLDVAIVGEPGSDALRALWGFDHLRRSLLPPNTPIGSAMLNLPFGVVALVLPWVSGVVLAPLGAIFGPVIGYNLAVGVLLWAAGVASAWLVAEVGGGWGPGLVVGSAWLVSPMLLHAVADGTAEHVAVWLLPCFLACAWRATVRPGTRAGALAGLFGGLVAFDSPYLAVYAAVSTLLLLPELRRRPGLSRSARGASVALPFALALWMLYRLFPLGSGGGLPLAELQALNVTDPSTWLEVAGAGHRADGPAPTLIPTALLLGSVVLGLLAGRRALAWLGVGSLMLLLSFGLSRTLPVVSSINAILYQVPGVGGLRFPERWLVPAALLLGTAGSLGLSRVLAALRAGPGLRTSVCGVLALALFSEGVTASGIRRAFPMAVVPAYAFSSWLHDQPEAGGYALLPQVRPAAPAGIGVRPVFARLGQELVPADAEALQVRIGRPSVGAPGLQTLWRRPRDARVERLLADWDDLTHPRLTGYPIPPGADDPRADRVRGEALALLLAGGLRWLVVDLGAYEGAGLDELRRQLGSHVSSEHHFDEGDGVLILALD